MNVYRIILGTICQATAMDTDGFERTVCGLALLLYFNVVCSTNAVFILVGVCWSDGQCQDQTRLSHDVVHHNYHLS